MRGVISCLFGVLAVSSACSSSNDENVMASDGSVDVSAEAASDAGTDSPIAYPSGPYGLAEGDVFPNHSWMGYRHGKGDFIPIACSDYYDPTGAKGIRAVFFTVNTTGGRSMTAALEVMYSKFYAGTGAEFPAALIANDKYDPPSKAQFDNWVSAVKATFDVILAPETKTDAGVSSELIGATGATPTNYLIDPRTMRIVNVSMGWDPEVKPCTTSGDCAPDHTCKADKACSATGGWFFAGLDALITKNGGTAPF